MAYEFKLPDLGEGLTEGEIARWLVAEGQEIAEDDPLVEIQTDKTTVEIPSPAAGKVARILVAEGEVVPVGTVLVVIGEDGAAPADEQPRAEPAASVPDDGPGTVPGPWPVGTCPGDAARPAHGRRARSRPFRRRRDRAAGPRDRGRRARAAGPRDCPRARPRRDGASRCAAFAASSPSTWPAPTARCRR